ncbi:polyphosphate kinase 2 family protein [Propionibacteriaceae bacterium Y1685]|uniref:polyphosphate kinase 2 family protein n=1 Tax=Microlunatus sp. Y1700 TaxID=3418487 RepID=UPI003B79D0C2
MAKKKKSSNTSLTDQLRVPKGKVDLSDLDPRATPGYPGNGKKDAAERTLSLQPELSDLQERLYAAGRAGDPDAKRVLVILQGMDTSGKGGVIRHAIGMVDPQGVQLKAFKAPTAAEKRHDYLWRIRKAVPSPGMIGIFDRSQYEDVLTVRVNKMVPAATWRKRFAEINAFESELVDQGTTVIKCFLHVSRDKQKERLAERLADPEKYWKYNPGDVDERVKWDAYQTAYADVLTRCNTEAAPWFVIPSDRKWYRNWAVAQLLTEHLRALDLGWPEADFDVEAEKERLAQS